MEDVVDFETCFAGLEGVEYYAVYDGHAGVEAADFVRRELPKMISQRTDFKNATSIRDAFHCAFRDVDASFLEELRARSTRVGRATCSTDASSGSVACVAIVTASWVHIANLGDCRAIMCRNGDIVQLTKDHRIAGNDGERKRLEALGVEISADGYINGRLSVTRAFGNFTLAPAEGKRPGILSYPDVIAVEVTGDTEFLVLACDGLFDQMSSREVGQIVRRRLRATGDAKEAAEALVKHSLKVGGTDNLSVIVVLFRPPCPDSEVRTAPRLFRSQTRPGPFLGGTAIKNAATVR